MKEGATSGAIRAKPERPLYEVESLGVGFGKLRERALVPLGGAVLARMLRTDLPLSFVEEQPSLHYAVVELVELGCIAKLYVEESKRCHRHIGYRITPRGKWFLELHTTVVGPSGIDEEALYGRRLDDPDTSA